MESTKLTPVLILASLAVIMFAANYFITHQSNPTLADGGPYLVKVEWFVSDLSLIPFDEGEFTGEAYLKDGCFTSLTFLLKKRGLEFDTTGGSKLCVGVEGYSYNTWPSGDYEFNVAIVGRALDFEPDIDEPSRQTRGGD